MKDGTSGYFQALTFSAISEVQAKADAISCPPYLAEILETTPSERELDNRYGATRTLCKAASLTKPAVCLLGRRKAFLLSYVLDNEILSSTRVGPTTVITVIRHVGDRPADWPARHNVFTLERGADLRTLDIECTTGGYDYADLPELESYSEAHGHEAIVVFLDKEILRRCTFYDCPGFGKMSSLHLEEDTDPNGNTELTPQHRASIRERELQLKAIADADAYMLVTSVTGANGGFADADTGHILYSIASNMAHLPTKVSHGNLLLIASEADPWKEGLEDEAVALAKLQEAIQKQVEQLPREQRQKFDLLDLEKRVVLFFALDRHQRELAIRRAALAHLKHHPDADQVAKDHAAEDGLEEERRTRERTAAFDKEFRDLVDLGLGMREYHAHAVAELADISIAYHVSKRVTYQSHATHMQSYELLYARYDREREAREQDWKSIAASFESDVDRAAVATIGDIEKTIDYWCLQDNVCKLLEDEFGDDRSRATTLAANVVSDRINEEFGESIRRHAVRSESEAKMRLAAFGAT